MKRNGQRAFVTYKGTLEDGTVFDVCEDEPFDFVLGTLSVIPGFERVVSEMEVGETVVATIGPDEAYGEYQEDALQKIPAYLFGENCDFPVGKRISLTSPNAERPAIVKVVSVEDGIVTFDFNHALAGQTLTYEITLHKLVGESNE